MLVATDLVLVVGPVDLSGWICFSIFLSPSFYIFWFKLMRESLKKPLLTYGNSS